MQKPRKKPGPVPRGDRYSITVRIPTEDWAVIDRRRTELGYANRSDYLAAVLAEHHGLAAPSYVQRSQASVEQPMLGDDGSTGRMLKKAG